MTKEDQLLNRSEIINMAREAGAGLSTSAIPLEHPWVFLPDELERFAALIASRVAAASASVEREACAKECDELAGILFCHGDKDGAKIAVSLRDTIRARGQA